MPTGEAKRRRNERQFDQWEPIENGGRRYRQKVLGHFGWKAIYFKEVDDQERTIRFWQEIYNEEGMLMEIHEKYPFDKGHHKLRS